MLSPAISKFCSLQRLCRRDCWKNHFQRTPENLRTIGNRNTVRRFSHASFPRPKNFLQRLKHLTGLKITLPRKPPVLNWNLWVFNRRFMRRDDRFCEDKDFCCKIKSHISNIPCWLLILTKAGRKICGRNLLWRQKSEIKQPNLSETNTAAKFFPRFF